LFEFGEGFVFGDEVVNTDVDEPIEPVASEHVDGLEADGSGPGFGVRVEPGVWELSCSLNELGPVFECEPKDGSFSCEVDGPA
jgi:hypothetical protein